MFFLASVIAENKKELTEIRERISSVIKKLLYSPTIVTIVITLIKYSKLIIYGTTIRPAVMYGFQT